MRYARYLVLAGLLAIAALSLSGSPAGAQVPSAAPASSADPSLDSLRERVLAYWQARVQRNYRAEYDLLEPRARAILDPEEYGRGRSVQYLAAQVEDVERRGNFARVGVRLLVRIQLPALFPRSPATDRTESTLLEDVWVRINGTWYRTREADSGNPAPWPAVDE